MYVDLSKNSESISIKLMKTSEIFLKQRKNNWNRFKYSNRVMNIQKSYILTANLLRLWSQLKKYYQKTLYSTNLYTKIIISSNALILTLKSSAFKKGQRHAIPIISHLWIHHNLHSWLALDTLHNHGGN